MAKVIMNSKSFRKQMGKPKRKIDKEPNILQKVRELYNKEYDIEQIAKKLGISIRDARYYYSLCGSEMVVW